MPPTTPTSARSCQLQEATRLHPLCPGWQLESQAAQSRRGRRRSQARGPRTAGSAPAPAGGHSLRALRGPPTSPCGQGLSSGAQRKRHTTGEMPPAATAPPLECQGRTRRCLRTARGRCPSGLATCNSQNWKARIRPLLSRIGYSARSALRRCGERRSLPLPSVVPKALRRSCHTDPADKTLPPAGPGKTPGCLMTCDGGSMTAATCAEVANLGVVPAEPEFRAQMPMIHLHIKHPLPAPKLFEGGSPFPLPRPREHPTSAQIRACAG